MQHLSGSWVSRTEPCWDLPKIHPVPDIQAKAAEPIRSEHRPCRMRVSAVLLLQILGEDSLLVHKPLGLPGLAVGGVVSLLLLRLVLDDLVVREFLLILSRLSRMTSSTLARDSS